MKHHQTVDPLQKESQVGRGLFGIRVLILHFKFQFSKSVKSSTFHIFLNLTYPLRKNVSFPKHLKITPKFTQNCEIVDNVISIEIWRRLKRDRDIGRKAVSSDVKTAPCTNSSLQISIFQIRQIFNISYFPQFNLSFEKKCLFPKTPKNHPKIYTKLPNSGQCNKHRDLASLETWPRYWQKGRVKRRENSLHVYPRLKGFFVDVVFAKRLKITNKDI